MIVIDSRGYKPPFWQINGHIQTIYPSLYRKVKDVNYQRQTITTSDDDFLVLDWSFAKYPSTSVTVLSHGLEGDSHRPYITGMVRELNKEGVDCVAWNFRTCGGVMNKQSRMYHSGVTDDLACVIQHCIQKGYTTIYLIGYSLGANLTLKYLGEQGAAVSSLIKKAVVFSAPMDLKACSLRIGKTLFKIYERRFLKSLKHKTLAKLQEYPELLSAEVVENLTTLYEFDNQVTAKLHGFKDADTYYEACSSKHYVSSITCPTLIINAENDPMIPIESLPLDVLRNHPKVKLLITSEGGHCGFSATSYDHEHYWSEKQAINFIKSKELI